MEKIQPTCSEAKAEEMGRPKEGSYASSVIPTQLMLQHEGSINYQDPGLTLLPGLQILSNDEGFLAYPSSDVANEVQNESDEKNQKGSVGDDRRFRETIQEISQKQGTSRKRNFAEFESQGLPNERLYSAQGAGPVGSIHLSSFSESFPFPVVTTSSNNYLSAAVSFQIEAWLETSESFTDLNEGSSSANMANMTKSPTVEEPWYTSDSVADDISAQLNGKENQGNDLQISKGQSDGPLSPKSVRNRSAIQLLEGYQADISFVIGVVFRNDNLTYKGCALKGETIIYEFYDEEHPSEVGELLGSRLRTSFGRRFEPQVNRTLQPLMESKSTTSFSADRLVRRTRFENSGVDLYMVILAPAQIVASGNLKTPQPTTAKGLPTCSNLDSISFHDQRDPQIPTAHPLFLSSLSHSTFPTSETFSEAYPRDEGPCDGNAFEEFLVTYDWKNDPMRLMSTDQAFTMSNSAMAFLPCVNDDEFDTSLLHPSGFDRAMDTDQVPNISDPVLATSNLHTSHPEGEFYSNEVEAAYTNANRLHPQIPSWDTSANISNAGQHLHDFNFTVPDVNPNEEYADANIYDPNVFDSMLPDSHNVHGNTSATFPIAHQDHQTFNGNSSAIFPNVNHDHHGLYSTSSDVLTDSYNVHGNTSAVFPITHQDHQTFNGNSSAIVPNISHDHGLHSTMPDVNFVEEVTGTSGFDLSLPDCLDLNWHDPAVFSTTEQDPNEFNPMANVNQIEEDGNANGSDLNLMDSTKTSQPAPPNASNSSVSKPPSKMPNAILSRLPPEMMSEFSAVPTISQASPNRANPKKRHLSGSLMSKRSDKPQLPLSNMSVATESAWIQEREQLLAHNRLLTEENQRLHREVMALNQRLHGQMMELSAKVLEAGESVRRQSTLSMIGQAGLQHQAGAIVPSGEGVAAPTATPSPWIDYLRGSTTAYQSPYAPIAAAPVLTSNRGDPVSISSSPVNTPSPSSDGLGDAIAEELERQARGGEGEDV